MALSLLGPSASVSPGNLLISPRTRRRQRLRARDYNSGGGVGDNDNDSGDGGGGVLENVTTASTLVNATVITPELAYAIDQRGPDLSRHRGGPSQDEMVIRARGRRQVPITFSPDPPLPGFLGLQQQQVQRRRHFVRASTTTPAIRARLLLPRKPNPKKRLVLGDDDHGEKGTRPSPAEKPRKPPSRLACKRPLPVLMRAFSHGQLVELLLALVRDQPELEGRLGELLPPPDLQPMEAELSYLRKNALRAWQSAATSSSSCSPSPCRRRAASVHSLALKRAATEQSRRLAEAEQWAAVLDHAVMAWEYVGDGCGGGKRCLRTLAANCMEALTRRNWSGKMAAEIQARMLSLDGGDELIPCISYLTRLVMNDGSNSAQISTT